MEGLCSGAGSLTTEDPGCHADHGRGIVFGTSGAGSVTTEDRGRHADQARGIVFGSGVGDYRRPRRPCGPC